MQISNTQPDARTYIVQLDARPGAVGLPAGASRAERKQAAASSMAAASTRAWQAAGSALAAIADAGAAVRLLPYVGAALVTVPRAGADAVVQALQGAAGVTGVWRDRTVQVDLGQPTTAGAATDAAPSAGPTPPVAGVEYHVSKVRAPEAWAAGATGAGVVIGAIDTGVDMDHELLRDAYRGHVAGGAPRHDHNWVDFVEPGGAPKDVRQHGTHTAAIAVGRGPKGVGVAPGASLIAARAIGPLGKTRQGDLLAALNWMAAPTDSAGANPDPMLAPDILTASWGLMGASDPYFRPALQALVRQGILPVFAAGNDGPGPSTLRMPASYPEVLTVASTDAADVAAHSSSRGPGPFTGPDGAPVPKPDVAAPGVNVVSAWAKAGAHDLYMQMSGTSMATPNVAGIAALLLGRYPTLTVAQLREAITTSTLDLGAPGFDTTYGSGRVDAVAALAAAAKLVAAAAPATR